MGSVQYEPEHQPSLAAKWLGACLPSALTSLPDSGEAKGSEGNDLGLRPWKQGEMWR